MCDSLLQYTMRNALRPIDIPRSLTAWWWSVCGAMGTGEGGVVGMGGGGGEERGGPGRSGKGAPATA